MNQVLKKQLETLTTYPFKVDGQYSTAIPDDCNEIVFNRVYSSDDGYKKVRVVFEKYILQPFEGFDFHDKWNNGIPPYASPMYGRILKETPKMYYFELSTYEGDKKWTGWCPKKSCYVYEI